MPRLLLVAVVMGAASVTAQQPSATPALDYEFFKARIQPVLTTKRDGNARCVSCHAFGTPMRLNGDETKAAFLDRARKAVLDLAQYARPK